MVSKKNNAFEKQLDELQDQIHAMRKKFKGAEKDVEKRIIDNPIGSVGTAFGIGAMVGTFFALFMRRRK